MPDIDNTLDNLKLLHTWAACNAIDAGDVPSIAQWTMDAITVIEAQRETLEKIDRYVRELDKAVNGDDHRTS